MITEALAEIKTIDKRIASKKDFVRQYLLRPDTFKDPMEKDGGSAKAVAEAMQAITDLEQRLVDLRKGIQLANQTEPLTIEGTTRTINDWLVWRREVASDKKAFLFDISRTVSQTREQVTRKNASFTTTAQTVDKPLDIVVNVNEKELAASREQIENILGQLDGQLSLKNATVMVAI